MRGPPGGWGSFSFAALVAAGAWIGIVAAAEAPALRLPPDRTYAGADGSPGPVVFSHGTHVPLADGRCVACHPEPFHILRPTGRLTHEEMNAGRQCGTCHDGTRASGVQDDCTRCHSEERAP